MCTRYTQGLNKNIKKENNTININTTSMIPVIFQIYSCVKNKPP